MRNDIIEYLQKEVYRRCKQPTNKFGMGCYYHIESVAKNAELLAEKYGADKEVVIIAAWLHDIASITDALVEVFSFGTLSKFYKNMLNKDKKAIAKTFGVGYTYFESWLESISYVRNICAHYGRIYNAKLSKTPILYKEYTQAGIGNNRIYGVLLCLKHLLKNDIHWNLFVDNIELLFDKYECVQISTMGFPENWKELLQH